MLLKPLPGRVCVRGSSSAACSEQEHRTGALQGSCSHWFPWKPEPEQGRAKLQHPCLLSKSKMGCQTFRSLGSSGCVWGLFIRSKLEVGYQRETAPCQAATVPAWSGASFPKFPSLIWYVSTFIGGVACQTPQLCQESYTADL